MADNWAHTRITLVGDWFRRAQQHPGLILLVVIALVQAFGPFARYCPVGFLDSWIYTSYFIDWPDMVRRFGGSYYGARVPYIAFGALFYKIFAPALANFLMNVTQTWLICYSVYRILRRFCQPASCLVYALSLTINVGLVQPVLWDYPDGPAIAYGFLGLWFCFAPPTWAAGLLGPFLGGAFYACSGHTLMIMGLVIAPAVLAQVMLAWQKGRKQVVIQLGAIGAGAIAVTGLFGFISFLAGGSFLFFWPQIQYAYWTLAHRHYSRWEQPVSAWLPVAYRLLTPAGALLLAALRLTLRKRFSDQRDSVIFASTVLLVASAALYAYFGLVKNALVLQVFYSSVFLLVPSLLYLGLLFCNCWKYLSVRESQWLTGITVAFLAIVLLSGPFLYTYDGQHGPRAVVYGSMVCIVLAALVMPVLRNSALPGGILLALSLLVISDFPLLAESSIAGPAFERQPPAFAVALHIRQLVAFAPSRSRTVRFWFDNDEQNLLLFDSIASLYTWQNPSQITALMEGTEQDRQSILRPNELFVVLSSDPQKLEMDEALLRKHNIEFERQGLVRIVRQPYDFYVGFLSVGGRGGASYVRNGTFDQGALAWNPGDAQLASEGGGESGNCLALNALRGPFQYAIQPILSGLEDHRVYELSFWVKSGSSGDDQFLVGIWEGNRWTTAVRGISRSQWKKYSTLFEHRAGTPVAVELVKNSPKSGSMLFDTIKLEAN